jgi:hypothetical protein
MLETALQDLLMHLAPAGLDPPLSVSALCRVLGLTLAELSEVYDSPSYVQHASKAGYAACSKCCEPRGEQQEGGMGCCCAV